MQGKTINGFELKRPLGVGGMAEVWYAENIIHKSAAVKILNPELAHNEQIVERFRNEAEVMVKLNHPNIRQVYGYGEIDGRPAIIMEYLDGDDLKQKIKQGQRFTEEQLRKWWDQLADALNYTHAQGIVHRDIKPGNIFVDNNDNIKLLDFGIAKVRESISSTQTGQKLGTLMYMSPEQVKDSKHIDYRTDLYSLAVTYVHLLTGNRPYDSDTSSDFEISEQIVYHPLDLSAVPMAWRSFLEPYLDKDPQKRPPLRRFAATTTNVPDQKEDDATFVGGALPPVVKSNVKQSPFGASSNNASNGAMGAQATSSDSASKPKSKKGLWIGIAAIAVVAALVTALLLRSGDEPKRRVSSDDDDDEWYDDKKRDDDKYEMPEAMPEPPVGAINGLFSVSPTQQVYFSKGNLQYYPDMDKWAFADYQAEVMGYSNEYLSSTYDGWVDLFGWGTGDNPSNISMSDTDYPYFSEWGNNMYEYGWRTLTADEWFYLFYGRDNSESKYGAAYVYGVPGIVILPDDFVMPYGCDLSTTYDENDYSMNGFNDNWPDMEAAGAVFLPAAGRRTELGLYNLYADGDYWSSTPLGSERAYNVDFSDAYVKALDDSPRRHGFAVRLVKDYY